MGCCHRNPVLELPIIIGSYPIEDAYPFGIQVNTVNAPDSPSNDVITQQPTSSDRTDQNDDSTVVSRTTQNASTSTEGTHDSILILFFFIFYYIPCSSNWFEKYYLFPILLRPTASDL